MGMVRLITLMALLSSVPAVQAAPLILNTDHFPPYQIRTSQGLEGSSVLALQCVFNALQQAYEIKVMPWERAIHEVEKNRADGFFSATRMPRAEPYATLSAPLALEKWYWYSNTDPASAHLGASGPRIGAIRGSNQLAWLLEQGIEVDQLVGTNEQLLKLLDRGRIDRFLADRRTLRTELTKHSVNMRPRFEQFYKYATLGVYFSNSLLAREPTLLEQFNRQVFYCLAETPALDQSEQTRILSLHEALFGPWPGRPELLDAIRQQNRHHAQLGIPEILALDQQWLTESSSADRALSDGLLARPASAWLRAQQQASDGLITEIMLTDRLGLLVAASERTTDYWQGDEHKFSEAFFAVDNAPYVGPVEFDQSSEAYQVHISIGIRDPKNNELIGTLITGLDIERALLKTEHGGIL